MAVLTTTGQPFVGNLSIASAGGGPTAIPLYVIAGSGSAYTLQAGEYVVITNIMITTASTTAVLVKIDDAASTAKLLVSGYVSTTQVIQESIPIGVAKVLAAGLNPRATAASGSTGTTEFVIKGVIARR